MTAEAPAPRVSRLIYLLAWVTIGSSFFVMFEPAPCDALFAVTLALAVIAGRRYFLPDAGLGIYAGLFLFVLANLGSLAVAEDAATALRFFAITVYLLLSFLLFAGLVGLDGPRMAHHLTGALCAAALAAALVGLLARFRLIPNAAMFFRDEHMQRIKSTFKDPNVFAPFLVAAFMLAFSRVIDGRRGTRGAMVMMVPLAAGILLAFSRGAWVHLAISLAVFTAAHVLFVRRPEALRRLAVAGALVPIILVPALVLFLLASDSSDYLARRVGLQQYDTENRFTNHWDAIEVGLANPQGIGPGMYSPARGLMAVHNLYIRVFAENGLLGLLAFMGFLAAALARAFGGVLARGESAGTHACCLAICAGALVESWIIDTLHWRHLFLVLAIPVGLAAYEARHRPRAGPRPARSEPEVDRAAAELEPLALDRVDG